MTLPPACLPRQEENATNESGALARGPWPRRAGMHKLGRQNRIMTVSLWILQSFLIGIPGQRASHTGDPSRHVRQGKCLSVLNIGIAMTLAGPTGLAGGRNQRRFIFDRPSIRDDNYGVESAGGLFAEVFPRLAGRVPRGRGACLQDAPGVTDPCEKQRIPKDEPMRSCVLFWHASVEEGAIVWQMVK